MTEKQETDAPPPTRQEVLNALHAVKARHGSPTSKKLVQQFGRATVFDRVRETDYASLLKAARAALDEPGRAALDNMKTWVPPPRPSLSMRSVSSGYLTGETAYELLIGGPYNQKAIERLIQKLQIDLDICKEDLDRADRTVSTGGDGADGSDGREQSDLHDDVPAQSDLREGEELRDAASASESRHDV